jgi:hypothetical protein
MRSWEEYEAAARNLLRAVRITEPSFEDVKVVVEMLKAIYDRGMRDGSTHVMTPRKSL